ncbi:MAG: amino acid permease [Bacteroidota bacterium]|nr:amino acid permease [Bacteroidota bacterium]
MAEQQKLKRTLGLAECIFFGVGSILGAGIYAILGKVAGFGGNMLWLGFAIASLTALMSAFSYAELSSMFPGAGGEYIYARKAYNKKIAILLGFLIAMNGIVSAATVSLAFAGYFSGLLALNETIAALGILALMFSVNIIGIRQSSVVNIIFTLIEAAGIVLVVITAAPHIGEVNLTELPPAGINGVLLAAALSYFAFIGFEEIVKLGKETKNPERTIPRALFAASFIVMILYIIVTICAVSAMPWQDLAASDSPLADVVALKYGQTGLIIVSVIALFSTSNTILSNMLGSSRVLLEAGGENTWMKKLAFVSKTTKTPIYALILIFIVAALFSLIGNLSIVALIANLFIFVTFLFVNIAVIVLRVKQPEEERPYRIPFTVGKVPLPSLIGVLMTLLLLGYTIYGLIIGTNTEM